MHSSSAFTQAVRVPAGYDTVYVGGQNGVDATGRVVGPDVKSQVPQALTNLQTCLVSAGADLGHVVKWTILAKEGESLQDGFAAFLEIWGERPNPPAITVVQVSGFAVPGAVVEIEAVAAIPPA